MRRLFLICLIALLAGVFLVSLLEKDPGYILIAYGKTTIEMSVWMGIGLALASFALLYFLLRAWRNTRKLPGKVGRWMGDRSERATHNRANLGLTDFIEGRWERARKSLVQVAERSDEPLIYYLLAARASHAMGDDKGLESNLIKAEQSASNSDLAVGLTQAELYLQRGQLEQALVTLERVRAVSPSHPVALKLLAQTYERLQDWPQLKKLLPDMRRANALPGNEMDALEHKVCVSLLNADVGAARLEQAWKSLPKTCVNDVEMQCLYAGQLIQAGASDTAEQFLRKVIRKSWDDRLVHSYGLAIGDDVVRQLEIAQRWQADRPNNPELLLCLGRLSLANQAWDKAQEYLESSLALSDKPETCAELGNLLARLGKQQQSIDYFQRCLPGSGKSQPRLPGAEVPATLAAPEPKAGQTAAG
jgi:HemY protein